MYQFASTSQWPRDIFGRAFQVVKVVATITLIGTNIVSFGAGLYLGKELSELRWPDSFNVKENLNVIKPTSTSEAQPSSPAKLPSAQDELSSKAAYLSIDAKFLMQLGDDIFHAQNPQLEGRQLTEENTPAERHLRRKWWQTIDAAAISLSQLDVAARENLGSYSEQDFQRLVAQAEAFEVRKESFQQRVNARLHRLLPALENAGFTNSESGKPSPKFQVWCAIAQEEIEKFR